MDERRSETEEQFSDLPDRQESDQLPEEGPAEQVSEDSQRSRGDAGRRGRRAGGGGAGSSSAPSPEGAPGEGSQSTGHPQNPG